MPRTPAIHLALKEAPMLNHFCKKPVLGVHANPGRRGPGTPTADTVITGARLVNVCTAEVQDDIDVAIAEGRIALCGAKRRPLHRREHPRH